ncbi:hypothetical protein TSAR_001760 [Trichomalopsis sarcophagae]|uniref:Uncharacterized protein n=1 Tax=Trichomalopsis sarcophagae TaxID=543379 RepID=A0A232EI81_9HYME|nr:hypothetical protein TSAR_001760 [Trichomalopsis sarcophagae]
MYVCVCMCTVIFLELLGEYQSNLTCIFLDSEFSKNIYFFIFPTIFYFMANF